MDYVKGEPVTMPNSSKYVPEQTVSYILHEVTTAIFNNLTNGTDNISAQPLVDSSLQMTRFIVQRILVPLVTVIGLTGNIISIAVLTHRSMVSSTNCYLTTLSVFDLLYLIFSFTLSLNHYPQVKQQSAYLYWFPYGRVLTDICSNVSVVLTVTFSLERLIAVCYPMKGRIICTPERARIITLFVSLAAIGCTAPEFFEFKTMEVMKNGELVVKITQTALYHRTSYKVGYQTFISVTFTILPLLLLMTFNGLLIRSVLTATRLRREMTTYVSVQQDPRRRQGDQNRITVMLIAVVVVFLLCQFPNAVLLLYRTYLDLQNIDLTFEEATNLTICANVVNLLIQINASINFILYSVMSTKFRRVFCRLFCRFSENYKYNVSRNGTEMSYFQSVSMRTQNMSIRYRDRRANSVLSRTYPNRDGRFRQHLDPVLTPELLCEKAILVYRPSNSCSSSSHTSDMESNKDHFHNLKQGEHSSLDKGSLNLPLNGKSRRLPLAS